MSRLLKTRKFLASNDHFIFTTGSQDINKRLAKDQMTLWSRQNKQDSSKTKKFISRDLSFWFHTLSYIMLEQQSLRTNTEKVC